MGILGRLLGFIDDWTIGQKLWTVSLADVLADVRQRFIGNPG